MKTHNWFSINGYIRTNDQMTAKELFNILEDKGIELFGSVIISDTDDEMERSKNVRFKQEA